MSTLYFTDVSIYFNTGSIFNNHFIKSGESATAIRDPAFYRWHAFIDQYFQIYKEKLRPYNEKEIGYESIVLSSLEFKTNGDVEPNVFNTFWQQSDIDLSRGMDFLPRGNIYARFESDFLFQI